MDDLEYAEEDEQQEFVRELLATVELEGAALGVAKLFADKGRSALSERQQYVLDEHVLGAHMVKACERCGQSIPWSEQAAALDNGGMCSWCDHMRHKVMEED